MKHDTPTPFGKPPIRLLAAAAAICSPLAIAGTADPGMLRLVHFHDNGVVIAYTTGARASVPACASTQPPRFAFDAKTAAGKAMLAGLLTAYSSGKPVAIFGTGTCAVWGDTESLSWFYTVD